MAFAYRRELKQPGALQRIDFGNPKLAPMIRMVVQSQRAVARAWMPPDGLTARVFSLPSWDGEPIGCFVIEPEAAEPLPGILYCHGGGFFLPVQTSALELAAFYAERLRTRVFMPDYRILPEHPDPYPFRDCLAVWEGMSGRAEIHRLDGRLLLYGESAGGALAAGLALWLRDHGGQQPAGQLLIYPALDDSPKDYPSMERCDGAVWTRRSNDYMWSAYLKNSDQESERYTVPMKNGRFDDLPPAYIEPQEFDILRDEATAYAGKLRRAGVWVELVQIAGSYHGFDTDVRNPFVRSVLEQRVRAMAGMLAHYENEEREP